MFRFVDARRRSNAVKSVKWQSTDLRLCTVHTLRTCNLISSATPSIPRYPVHSSSPAPACIMHRRSHKSDNGAAPECWAQCDTGQCNGEKRIHTRRRIGLARLRSIYCRAIIKSNDLRCSEWAAAAGILHSTVNPLSSLARALEPINKRNNGERDEHRDGCQRRDVDQ